MASDPPLDSQGAALSEAARTAWLEFRRAFQDLRPELYRFCRSITRSPWDAEDLVQDTLMRAFVMLGSQYGQTIDKPRSWLFRVATNTWIDRKRRTREEPHDDVSDAESPARDAQAERELAGTLLARLSPQERVAIVLKDAFELSLEDVAEALDTTVGAVKAALHRGRGKLRADEPEPERTPLPAAITEFCRAFNASDLDAVVATLLDSAIVEIPGVAVDLSVTASGKLGSGILYHSLLKPLSSGVPEAYLVDYVPLNPRAELRAHRGENLLLLFYQHRDGVDALRCFARFSVDSASGRIARLRQYYYSPEALSELARELDVPYRSNGYGF
jgi:RNA polymerase sigma-70 factor (ECF subfamily)